MKNTLALLDQAELRQLGINASDAGDEGTAIAYFKEAASRPDADGAAHYLLGAHYAQIRMYDRAVGQMEAALALEPGLSIARFQLGLLWLTSGQSDQAITAFAPLQELAENDALRLFGQGLTELAHERLSDASASLAKGIELNLVNPALNLDMQMFIEKIATVLAAPPVAPTEQDSAAEPATQPDEGNAYRHLLKAAYGDNTTT